MKNLLLKIDFGIDVESRDWKINKLLKKKVLIVLIAARSDPQSLYINTVVPCLGEKWNRGDGVMQICGRSD